MRRTPYSEFWRDLFGADDRRYSPSEYDWILSNFSKDHLDEQLGFSDLHRAVIAFKNLPLFNAQLRATPRTAINEQDSNGYTALSWASYLGKTEIMTRLLQRGADPNLTDYQNQTSLHRAVYNDYLIAIACLADGGINVNTQDIVGNSALFEAIRYNTVEPTKLLTQPWSQLFND